MGRVVALLVDRPTGRVHEYFSGASFAMKLLFVGRLDAQFADQAGAGICIAVDLLQVLFIDGTDVPDGMHRRRAEGVVPSQARSNVHSRELVAVHGKQRHLFFRELQLDGHTLVHLMQQHRASDVADFFGSQQPDADQRGQGRVQRFHVSDLFAHQFDLKGRQVVGEHDAMTIQNQAAARRYRFGSNPIALGKRGIVVVS